jgi:hypothetical protein
MYLERGKSLRPSSIMINALLATTYHRIGNRKKAQVHYRLVEEQAPHVAKSLAYIEGPEDHGRASGKGDREPLLWSIEAE